MDDRNFIVIEKETGEIVCLTNEEYKTFNEPWVRAFSSNANSHVAAGVQFALEALVDMDTLEYLIDQYLDDDNKPSRIKQIINLFSEEQKTKWLEP